MIKPLLKLKKLLTRRDKKTGYEGYRYDVTIPTSAIDELGWKTVKNLKYKIERGKITIEKD